MKKGVIVLLFLLCGCGRFGPDYQPHLAVPPKDSAKYEVDRKSCIDEAKHRQEVAKPTDASGNFGLLGYAYDQSFNNQDDDYHKRPSRMTDECMSKRGYNVIP